MNIKQPVVRLGGRFYWHRPTGLATETQQAQAPGSPAVTLLYTTYHTVRDRCQCAKRVSGDCQSPSCELALPTTETSLHSHWNVRRRYPPCLQCLPLLRLHSPNCGRYFQCTRCRRGRLRETRKRVRWWKTSSWLPQRTRWGLPLFTKETQIMTPLRVRSPPPKRHTLVITFNDKWRPEWGGGWYNRASGPPSGTQVQPRHCQWNGQVSVRRSGQCLLQAPARSPSSVLLPVCIASCMNMDHHGIA